ncbi:MAG TPA: lysophospholipid acyltransferase family protein [Desulfobacteria bacterium]|nr:lysophospholipid acyltransferase family protein [Desulfobacteria bacterium]
MRPYLTGDSYDTPAGAPRRIWDRLALNSRWYFVYGYAKEVVNARSLALKGLYDTAAWAESSYNVFKLIEGCGGRFHLRGMNNISACEGPVVFISNHMSTLETFVFPCIIAPHMEVTFVVKDSLVKHPLFGPVMRARDPIVVGRTNAREDFQTVMNEGKRLLSEGTSLIIFPQSTRSVPFIPEEFNSLGIKLAKAAGVQVVPVAIRTDFWGNGKVLKDLGVVDRSAPVHMTFGEPFFVEGSGKEDHKKVVDFIWGHVRSWGVPVCM